MLNGDGLDGSIGEQQRSRTRGGRRLPLYICIRRTWLRPGARSRCISFQQLSYVLLDRGPTFRQFPRLTDPLKVAACALHAADISIKMQGHRNWMAFHIRMDHIELDRIRDPLSQRRASLRQCDKVYNRSGYRGSYGDLVR